MRGYSMVLALRGISRRSCFDFSAHPSHSAPCGIPKNNENLKS